MKIDDILLDNFTRDEYVHFLNLLINYYYVLFDEELELTKKVY